MSADQEHLSVVIDKQALRRDLYFLVSLLLADQKLKQSGLGWANQFHENEVVRLMMWMAVAVRSLLDHLSNGNNFASTICGEYWPDYRDRRRKRGLTLRQACNSIIHATEILPYRLPEGDSRRSTNRVYADRITVRSIGPGASPKRTRALLDATRFAKSANMLIETIEGEDDADR